MKKKYLYILSILFIITALLIFNKLSADNNNKNIIITGSSNISGYLMGNYPFELATLSRPYKDENGIIFIKLWNDLDNCKGDESALKHLEKQYFVFNELELDNKLKEIKWSRPWAYYTMKKDYNKYKKLEIMERKYHKNIIYFKTWLINEDYAKYIENVKMINIKEYEPYSYYINNYLFYKILASILDKGNKISGFEYDKLKAIKNTNDHNLLMSFYELSNGNIKNSIKLFEKIEETEIKYIINKDIYEVLNAILTNGYNHPSCYRSKLINIITAVQNNQINRDSGAVEKVPSQQKSRQ